jgi:hypothetical protein
MARPTEPRRGGLGKSTNCGAAQDAGAAADTACEVGTLTAEVWVDGGLAGSLKKDPRGSRVRCSRF